MSELLLVCQFQNLFLLPDTHKPTPYSFRQTSLLSQYITNSNILDIPKLTYSSPLWGSSPAGISPVYPSPSAFLLFHSIQADHDPTTRSIRGIDAARKIHHLLSLVKCPPSPSKKFMPRNDYKLSVWVQLHWEDRVLESIQRQRFPGGITRLELRLSSLLRYHGAFRERFV